MAETEAFEEDYRDALEESNVVTLPQFHSKDQVTRARSGSRGNCNDAQNHVEGYSDSEEIIKGEPEAQPIGWS